MSLQKMEKVSGWFDEREQGKLVAIQKTLEETRYVSK